MNLRFGRITLKNFRSFLGSHTIDLSGQGVHFLQGRNEVNPRLGSNGSGKSTLFESLVWCLYGVTLNGLRTPDLRPWSNPTAQTEVEVEIFTDDSLHLLSRHTDPNRILLDGKSTDQPHIDQLLRFSRHVFVNAICLGQDLDLFLDLAPRDKMALLTDTLNLDRWDQRSENAKKQVDELEKAVATLDGELKGLERAIAGLKELITQAHDKSKIFEAERQKDLKVSESQRTQLRDQVKRQEELQAGASLRYDGAATEVKSLEREAEKLRVEQLAYNANFAKFTSTIETRQRLLKDLELLKTAKTCPVCQQPVKPSNLSTHRQKLEEALKQTEKTLQTKEALDKAGELLQSRMAQTTDYLLSFKSRADGAKAELDRLNVELATTRTQLRGLDKAVQHAQDVTNPHMIQARDLSKRLEKTKEDLRDRQTERQRKLRQAEQTKFWVKGFKEVKLQLIEDLLQELELTMNGMLDDVGLVDWQVKFLVERETKSGTVNRALTVQIQPSDNTQDIKWESWSGGEKQRLRVIGSLALADVLLNHAGVECELEIFDEPTVYHSREGIIDLCIFLADRARQLNKSIWYVDHAATQSTQFVDTKTVIRGKEGSYIREG